MDTNAGTANIDNEPIAGFMDAMTMPYTIKPPSTLDQLRPGDSITADVVVESDKYWLENVKVTGHPKGPAGTPTATVHIPNPGDPVPDFKLINQNGKRISLHQYRGQTLLLTLIYTRCPFPDFCPRVSHEFAAIDRQVRAAPARYGRTHLLSISFDPAHDTPKVLRAYGFSCAGSKDSALFTHWEFSAVPPAELPKFADYFALTYKKEGGLITHSLSIRADYLVPTGLQLGLGRIGFHMFRHTYRAWLDETGAPVGVQQKLMRHAHISTTMDQYGNASALAKRRANRPIVQRLLRRSATQQVSIQ